MQKNTELDIEKKTVTLIQQHFLLSEGQAQQLAIAVLMGLESHGLDSNNWETIVETVNIVVSSWIKNNDTQ